MILDGELFHKPDFSNLVISKIHLKNLIALRNQHENDGRVFYDKPRVGNNGLRFQHRPIFKVMPNFEKI